MQSVFADHLQIHCRSTAWRFGDRIVGHGIISKHMYFSLNNRSKEGISSDAGRPNAGGRVNGFFSPLYLADWMKTDALTPGRIRWPATEPKKFQLFCLACRCWPTQSAAS
jgi:hypothetical protein